MRRTVTAFVVIVVLLAGGVIAQQKRQQDIDLQAAIRTETVDGDLNGAIKQYGAIVSKYKADRAVTATALVHMAECYQKMGGAQARKIYEQLVRDFGDQKDAVAIARAYLGGGSGATRSAGDRAVWTGPHVDEFGTVSPDGRFLTYTDWYRTNNVMLRDLVAGTDRPLTTNVSLGDFGRGSWSAISKTGEQIAYSWAPAPTSPTELRIASLRGSGIPPFKRILQSQGKDTIRPFDWSPDGKWIAVLLEREDRSSQLGIVSVQDGALRTLKSIDWRGVNKVVFSPDGRFIAYDLAVGEARDRAHIYVMAIDGSRQSAVVDDSSNNNVMGWSPDGHLLFASDRSGAVSLWAVPIENGKAQAAPTLVKANIGSSVSLGLTPSGTLYVVKNTGAAYVRVAPIDMGAGKLQDATTGTFQRFIEGRGRPDWSADGKHLLYMSCGPKAGGETCIVDVRSMETGVVREVPHKLTYLTRPRISPDGHAIVTDGIDFKGRSGIYLIDVTTGETTLVTPRTGNGFPDWSTDGKRIHYQQRLETPDRPDRMVILEREIGSEAAREIFRIAEAGIGPHLVSPDGRFVGYLTREPGGHTSALLVAPIAGGAARPLLRATDPEQVTGWLQWTPDSQAFIVQKGVPAGGSNELWLAPLTGQPRRLDIDLRNTSGIAEGGFFELHPDGRQVAFVATAGGSGYEIWALENFMPAEAATKQTAKE